MPHRRLQCHRPVVAVVQEETNSQIDYRGTNSQTRVFRKSKTAQT
jgi:hypothetical protein